VERLIPFWMTSILGVAMLTYFVAEVVENYPENYSLWLESVNEGMYNQKVIETRFYFTSNFYSP
jgi:hypothetical protein